MCTPLQSNSNFRKSSSMVYSGLMCDHQRRPIVLDWTKHHASGKQNTMEYYAATKNAIEYLNQLGFSINI